jgi:flagellar basal-body rod modification protein FlgD
MPITPIDTTASQPTTDRTQLASNYNTFLVLLTSQLQNQDPLQPMDSAQFTQQLVQYSQVEQQIRTNEQLSTLVSNYQAASAGTALSYLGRDALIESDATSLANGQASWAYSLPTSANDVTLTVKDAQGRVIFQGAGERSAGSHLFNWDGKDINGNQAADGVYHLTVAANDSEGASITPIMTVRETIMGVDFSGTTPLVITASGSRDLSTIRAVLDRG